MRVRRLRIQLDAVWLRPSYHSFLRHLRQRFPPRRIVSPLLQEEDRATGAGPAFRNEHHAGRGEQTGILGAILKARQVAISPVRPARRLIRDSGDRRESVDCLARLVKDHVVGAAGEPEHRVVLGRRHHVVICPDHVFVEAH